MSETQTPEEIEAEIEAQRAHLADTVDQLGHKLDMKAQAKARLSRLGPQHAAMAAAAVVALGALVWWRRGR
jgi:hypothetical protein